MCVARHKIERSLIIVMMMIDLGAFVGTPGDNRFGPEAEPVKFR